MTGAVAAVDLGATSGRVMIGRVGGGVLTLESVARFANGPVRVGSELHWDFDRLYASVVDGLAAARRAEPGIRSIGVDAWAVDYALLKGDERVGPVVHYRDARNLAAAEAVHEHVSHAELYAINGLQYLPFNTLYQFEAERDLAAADSFVLVPDLVNFLLTGRRVAERTNASTTGLLSVTSHDWDSALIERLQLPSRIFPELVDAGTIVGQTEDGIDVVAVGSHDTASAVVAIPAKTDNFAYISCGTWGLVGVELESPVLTEASRLANFTNEGGVDGRVRYLHNVMGLWLLSECVRTWEAEGEAIDLPALLDAAAATTASLPVFDANDESFLAPGDMPDRIAAWLRSHGQAVPASRAQFVRVIIESLANAFAQAVEDAARLAHKRVDVVHMVGGGSLNTLLCQLTADRSGRPVLAGPVEATALGNVLVQARAEHLVEGDLESLRALVAATFPPVEYRPRVEARR